MKRALAAFGLLAGALAAQAQVIRPETLRAESDWMAGVHTALDHRDCPVAVSRLNDGLEARYLDAYLLAGAMFEQGLCVKPQWERAERLYQQAYAQGHRAGLYRLVAGWAERDPPVALWWAQQGSVPGLPDPCRAPVEVHGDAAAYARMLGELPSGRLSVCAYVVGVVAAVFGEVEYPGPVKRRAVTGRVKLDFTPAQGRIDWRDPEFELDYGAGIDPPAGRRARDQAEARESVLKYLDSVAQRAVARYPVPSSVDPQLQVTVVLAYTHR